MKTQARIEHGEERKGEEAGRKQGRQAGRSGRRESCRPKAERERTFDNVGLSRREAPMPCADHLFSPATMQPHTSVRGHTLLHASGLA